MADEKVDWDAVATERATAAQAQADSAKEALRTKLDAPTDDAPEPEAKPDEPAAAEPEGPDQEEKTEEKPAEEKPGDKPSARWMWQLRETKRKLREATAAQERVIQDYGPLHQAVTALTERGDTRTFVAALAARGIDVARLRAALGGAAPAAKQGQQPQPQPEQWRDPRVDELVAEREAAQRAANEARFEEQLKASVGDHAVLKLPGGLAELRARIAASYDARTRRCMDPRAAADAIIQDQRARAEALGFAAPAGPTPAKPPVKARPRATPDAEIEAQEPAPEPVEKPRARTPEEWDRIATARALRAQELARKGRIQ